MFILSCLLDITLVGLKSVLSNDNLDPTLALLVALCIGSFHPFN